MKGNVKDIDFVILWVDGNDPAWLEERNKYKAGPNGDDRTSRYRDWNNLKYLFRGIERYTPWVRKVHFVTWGHLPRWMNINHPKLNIVNHRDFISEEYLPTFSCNSIELNLHRIDDLAEQFVYFNDDMFVIKDTDPEIFFKNGLPCDSACLNVPCYNNLVSGLTYDTAQATCLINKYYNMRDVLRRNPLKWFNIKYGKYGLRTLYLLPCPRFPGLWNSHMPSSYLKSTFEELWSIEEGILHETCLHKFREPLDYTQASFKFYQLASGNFIPRKANVGARFLNVVDKKGMSREAAADAVNYIKRQKGHFCVLYDNEWEEEEFIMIRDMINEAFDMILPNKSEFEL